MNNQQRLVLLTIPMSHYCEKARWGLERLDLAYFEERHLQGFHYPRTWKISKGPNVPVLIDSGKVISDSTRILQHLDQYASPDKKLYPDNPEGRREVEGLEDWFDEMLGVESRRWVYFHMMSHPLKALSGAGQGVPVGEKLLALPLYPFIAGLIYCMVRPTEKEVNAGLDKCRELVTQIDRRLMDGRRYLTGDRFTAADLALACMFSPFVMPKNYGIRLPEPEEVPRRMADDIHGFRATETGKFVMRLFETERVLGSGQQTSGVEHGMGKGCQKSLTCT